MTVTRGGDQKLQEFRVRHLWMFPYLENLAVEEVLLHRQKSERGGNGWLETTLGNHNIVCGSTFDLVL